MRQATFVERRQEGWERLDALLQRAERSTLRALGPDEVAEVGRLYRWVTSDLAFADGRSYDATLRAYLNRLTARAHALVYGGSSEGGASRVARFYTQTFPQEVWRSRWYMLLAVVLFLAPAGLAYYLIHTQPLNAFVLLPADMVAPIHKGLHETNFEPSQAALGAPTLSAFIMTNNIRLAFMAFAGGMTLGFVTVYVLIENGLILGGLAALYVDAGFGRDFWATIAPHGIIELTAVQIAAGAGLVIAGGILAPGRLRRRDALVRNARRAAILIVGVASMLVVAGTIEGFFSPQKFPADVRLAVGGITAVLLVLYFVVPNARRPQLRADSST
ncbi:MAG: stage II sporulation protein M [Candidatus Eremiobacteraeota bacterium]|nr:stage II sporulation protein M [Candidatus Eremiobacteraeota bacterium]MBV8263370.1 stage II sporulation protein M [Candidatus Eremiobacteraeota bacterium]MBV8340661.1 stage II sporulation protein M [Candidatus Eremiobacteraeota bacterium]MBV8461402.1 stage II sporulation protein M [Candidatus Eremiobacteraeota bacterium]MBV8594673.1 stage II sporulation protein M [Candidatus Eremiobacteraeota bacterium]